MQCRLKNCLCNALKDFFPKSHPDSVRISEKTHNRWVFFCPETPPRSCPRPVRIFCDPCRLRFPDSNPSRARNTFFSFLFPYVLTFFAVFDEPAEPYNEMDLGFGISRKNDAECRGPFICSSSNKKMKSWDGPSRSWGPGVAGVSKLIISGVARGRSN